MELVDYAPFALQSMTLRGIGSYLVGQRLDIRPLTVLCGENGTGKSTWLKVLRMLHESLDRNYLPFGFAIEDWEPNNVQLTNAFYHLAPSDDIQRVVHAGDEAEFGVPGTIGLEFVAQVGRTRSEDMPPPPSKTTAFSFIFDGTYPQGTLFRIRLAHPSHQHDQFALTSIRHLIELTIDRRHVLRFEADRDPHQRFHENLKFPRRQKPYRLTCSRSFLYGFSENHTELVEVGQMVNFPYPELDVWCDLPVGASFAQTAIERIRELLGQVLGSVFDIGAIRLPHDEIQLGKSLPLDVMKRRPHVGTQGEHSWQIEGLYSHKRMRDPFALGNLEFKAAEIEPAIVQRAFASTSGNRKFDRMIYCMPDEFKLPIWRLRNANRTDVIDSYPNPEGQEPSVELNSQGVKSPSFTAEFFSKALNSIVDRADLDDGLAWSTHAYYGDADNPETRKEFNDEFLYQLVENGRQSRGHMSSLTVRLRNYLLIIDAFFDEGLSASIVRDQLPFDQYLSYWLNFLLGVSLSRASAGVHKSGTDSPITESFYRMDPRQFQSIAPLICESDDWDQEVTATRIHHPCFGKGVKGFVQPPRQLSAAFHQLYPILVQLGVAKAGQLIGIENPEVHLHPALQTKVAELLVAHAKCGRRILIETHSDLVVRRVMRALLEESISQQEVAIYMTSLRKCVTVQLPDDVSTTDFYASRIEPLEVDERGRICNWPPGFLDEDVAEARRLMEIMYGTPAESDWDDDE